VRKGGAYRNTQEAAYSLMGLAELVRVKEREAPDFTARVVLGGKELASAEFRKRSLDTVSKKLPLPEESADKQLPLEFKVDGTGTLYYSALLRYAPAQMPRDARNEGVFVQRWFEPYDQPGKQTLQFAAGDLVRVVARIATPQERNYLALEIPLPAGLEAVDTSLATTAAAKETQETRQLDESEEAAPEYGFWSPFNYSEKRDDRVIYFSDHLPPGLHVVSFVARATTPGKFVLKPAHAGEMYAPEVFGRSEGGEVTVAAQQPLAAK
jgi:alpha-2-macroglobulin